MVISRQWRCAMLLGAVFTASCATPTQRIDRDAERAGLTRELVRGTDFRHVVYRRSATDATHWLVFIEGDGMPWVGGRAPASDPTTRDALALKLMEQSQAAALYVSRPCYQEVRDEACRPEVWTFERFSDSVVASMTRVIERELHAANARDVTLVGYSGGGVLAVLIAERLQNVRAVVTLGANLDTAAWSAHHGYLPLHASLDPARSERAHPWKELHLQGALDTVVPHETTRAYFERFPNAKQLAFDHNDHVCCWVRDWANLQERIRGELE